MPLNYSKKTRFAIAGIKTITVILFVLLLPAFLIAQTSTTIASAEITFVFLSNDTDGSISGFSSSSIIDAENPSNSVFRGEVKTESLETGNFLRNWSLRGSKYFDVDTYPTITFSSTSVSETDSGYSVKGDLTIKDSTQPITIFFTRSGKNLTGTTTLFSSDFGVNIKKKREDNKVSVKMVFQLR